MMSKARLAQFFQTGQLTAVRLMWDARRNCYNVNVMASNVIRRDLGFKRWWNAKEYIKQKGGDY